MNKLSADTKSRLLFVGFLLFAVTNIFAAAAPKKNTMKPAVASAPSFKKVFIVILENENNEDAYAQPFLRRLADEGAYLDEYHGVRHPSYPNYLALTSGSTWDVTNDRQRTIDGTHIGDLLEAKGKTWRVYAEGYPGDASNCFLDSVSGAYARRHVPFLSYKNVQDNPSRCANVRNASELQKDIEHGTLADYTLYIPDNNNNGHDTSVAFADRAMSRTFSTLLKDSRFTDGMLFVVTFDEDDDQHGNHIYTALWGAGVKPGFRSQMRYDHYSILRTIEDAFELGTLGRNDATAASIAVDTRKRSN